MAAIVEALERLGHGQDLSPELMEQAVDKLMRGEASPAQIGGLLMALRTKGETVEEIAAAARVMRAHATRVEVGIRPLLDTCGTGGDGRSLFNVSTAVAFVVAAVGGHVAKHGNRSQSGRSGSSDALEAAGVSLELPPPRVADCIREHGVGFMFAPAHHGATRHVAPVRRELGSRTLFNLLGPLTNPAGADRQVLGVYDRAWVRPMAEVLESLGSERVMVLHSDDGLDEVSPVAPTWVAELRDGGVTEYSIDPGSLDVGKVELDDLVVGSPEHSLRLIREALAGVPGAATEMVALNAAAALMVCDLAEDMREGLERARSSMGSGAPLEVLGALSAVRP